MLTLNMDRAKRPGGQPFLRAAPVPARRISEDGIKLYGCVIFILSRCHERQPRAADYGALDIGRHLRQRLDRRAQRHCHLHHHPVHEAPAGHYAQRGVQLPGRAGDDPLQQLGGLHHQQHGGLWRRHPGGTYRPVRGAVFHCGLQRGGFHVRHPHQREPQLDCRPFRRSHRHPERRGGHQHVRVGQGPLRPGGKPCLGLLHWLGGLQGLDHSLPQDGPPAHQPVLYRRGDFRRRGHELYA